MYCTCFTGVGYTGTWPLADRSDVATVSHAGVRVGLVVFATHKIDLPAQGGQSG